MESTLLAKPRFAVEGYEGPRGAHLYRAVRDSIVLADALPSVTKKLDIIGGSKTGALMGWAVKEALSQVKTMLLETQETGPVQVDAELIDKVVAAGRKRPGAVKDAAADLGTRVHGLIDEWIIQGYTRSLAEDEKVAFGNFLDFVRDMGLKFVSGDLAVASLRRKYGGRMDALAISRGKVVLLDWKTSNAIRNDYALQVAGYRMALEETYGIRADRAMVVRFDKVDPKVLDYREVALGQATKTWNALVKFEAEYGKEVWK